MTGDGDRAAAAPGNPAVSPTRPAAETCATRSEADFPRPFRDPRNLVVGPLALVGAGVFTPPSVVRRFGGQKFPLLVRNGHTVRIEVAAGARAFAGLGYGPLPQGDVTLHEAHEAVRFTACPPAQGRYTFWSGFVVAPEPRCVPLDVYVDGAREPRRVAVELGVRPCPQA